VNFDPRWATWNLAHPEWDAFFLINGHIETADQYGNWYTGR